MKTQTTQTYAEFLLAIADLFIEYNDITPRNYYLCNLLSDYTSRKWVAENLTYVNRLKASIKKKISENSYKGKTLTYVLADKYPGDPVQRRVAWLKDLAKYHEARGTNYCFQETRNWLCK